MNKINPTISMGGTKSTKTASVKKAWGRTAKLKSSKWYHSAAQSIGITTERSLESRNDKLG